MAAAEVFANRPTTQIPAGADAPASGAVETWTVTSSASFPAAATGATQFHVTDTVATTEIILVTNVSGTTWTVTRGAENTVPVTHQPGFVIYQVMTAGWLNTIATVPVTVPGGGTGGTALTAYALLAGGTAAASPVQQVSGLGTSGYVLTSGGAGSLPTWQPSAGGAGGVQLAGDLGGGSAVPQVISTHFPVVTIASASGTVNLDPTSTRVFNVTETGNCALTFNSGSQLYGGTAYSFEAWLYQDGTGGRATTFPASVSWIGGTAPTPNTAGSALNLFVFETLSAGTAWTGSLVSGAPSLPLTTVNGGTGLNAAGSAGTFFTSQGATTPGAWAGIMPAGTVQTTSFTATLGQLSPADASGTSITATLPHGQFAGQLTAVKMISTASSNTVTVKATAPDVHGRATGWTSGSYGTSATLSLSGQGQLATYRPAGPPWPVTAAAGAATMTILTSPAPFAAGQLAFFTAGSAPSGLSVNTPYYVTSVTGPAGGTVSFQVGTASAGPAITPSTTGSAVLVQTCGNWTTVADDLPLSQLQTLFIQQSVMTAGGDTIYESGDLTAARLGGNTSSTKEFLTSTGSGGTANAPAWGALQSGDIPANAANTSGSAATAGTAATANALNSATTAVAVSGAAAPTSGQVLTASSGTVATWSFGLTSVLTTGGDTLYESGALAPVRLAGNTGSTKNFLTSTGSGGTANAPAWGTIAAGDVPVLNQNTTGTATTASVANALAASGGTIVSVSAATAPSANQVLTATSGTTATWQNGAEAVLTTKGDLLYENATPALARLPVGGTYQMLGVSSGVPAWANALAPLAATGAAGYSLINGTGTVISWTAPNDGAMHRVAVFAVLHVISTETGGAMEITLTLPDGTSNTKTMFSAAQSANEYYPTNASCPQFFLIEANTTFSVIQNGALTGGTATAWAELWGS